MGPPWGKEGESPVTTREGRGSFLSVMAWLRTRSIVPVGLAALVVLYEFGGKGRVVPPGSVAERVMNIGLFLVVGPAMAWWGVSMARPFLQRLARAEAASEEKSRLLEQRNRQLQIVLQASRAMSSVLDVKEVAHAAVQQVITYTRFVRASLVLGPDGGGRYELISAIGLPHDQGTRLKEVLNGENRSASPVEWCRLTRQPVVVENLARDFRTAGLRNLFAQTEVQGMIVVPLMLRDRFTGALIVFLEKPGPISTAEVSLVSALAAQAALSLENARLYSAVADHLGRSGRVLEAFEGIASSVARSRHGVAPVLHLVAQTTAELFAPAAVRLLVNRDRAGSPLAVTESAGMDGTELDRPAADLPMTADGDEVGQFQLFRPDSAPPLEEEDFRLLRAMAQVTVAAAGSAGIIIRTRKAVDEVERAYMGTLEALTKALEMRDHETQGHSRRVVQYTIMLAQKLGVPEDQMVPIMRGALLHDIGKIGIPDAILKKQGPLTDEQWTIMKMHPRIGYEMLQGIGFLEKATPIILHHHERFDGTGYPHGLSGKVIPLGARIFAVADAYDAITSDRPYRKGRSHEYALREIAAGAGKQFDPEVVEVLLSLPEEELVRIRRLTTESAQAE